MPGNGLAAEEPEGSPMGRPVRWTGARVGKVCKVRSHDAESWKSSPFPIQTSILLKRITKGVDSPGVDPHGTWES